MKTHDVYHPSYGVVDQVMVDGSETPEELKAFEMEAFARLRISGPGEAPFAHEKDRIRRDHPAPRQAAPPTPADRED